MLLFFILNLTSVWRVTAPNTGIWTEVPPAEGSVS